MLEINQIYNMDCLEGLKQLPDKSVDCIVTDPPFGCNASLKGEYNDDVEYIKSQIPVWLKQMYRVLKDNSHIYIYVPTKYIDNWLPLFKQIFKFNNIIVCVNMKKGVKYPNMFNNNYQMILYGSKGRARNFNKIDWIKTSDSWFKDKRNKNPQRYRYEYPSFIPSYIKATVEESVGHPDEKNTILIKNLIKISTSKGDLVLDCFAGSGSTLLSAKETERRYLGFEINSNYFDLVRKRLGGSGVHPTAKPVGIPPKII